MKLHWRLLKKLFGALGFIFTYGALTANLFKVPVLGLLSWEWYTLIGVSVLLIALGATIAELHLTNRNLTSQDKEQEREIRDLEIRKLKREEHPM